MNIDFFENKKYQEMIKKYAKRIVFEKTKPFSDYETVDYKEIIKDNPIIEQINFFCYLQQSWFGYMLIDNKYYVIEVDDECMINIVAENEVGWMEGPLWIYDDHEAQFKSLQIEMNKEFNTQPSENNYEEFQKVMDRYPEWFN
jgi:hypothetical protein